jgi:hypothetical protein
VFQSSNVALTGAPAAAQSWIDRASQSTGGGY